VEAAGLFLPPQLWVTGSKSPGKLNGLTSTWPLKSWSRAKPQMMVAEEEMLRMPMSGSTTTTSLMRHVLLTRLTGTTMEWAAVLLSNAKTVCRTEDAGPKLVLKFTEWNSSERWKVRLIWWIKFTREVQLPVLSQWLPSSETTLLEFLLIQLEEWN